MSDNMEERKPLISKGKGKWQWERQTAVGEAHDSAKGGTADEWRRRVSCYCQLAVSHWRRNPLISKASAPRETGCTTYVVAALVFITVLFAFFQYCLSLTSDLQFSQSHPDHWSPSLADLSAISTHVDLAECSIPRVEKRDWSSFLASYKPPACPKHVTPARLPVGTDEVLIGGSAARFNIHPRATVEPATPEKPSIAIIFLDAVSRASFFRNFGASAALVQNRMARGEAFTFGGLAATDRYTPPNAAMVLAGISCSDGELSGFVYQTFCEGMARSAPGDVALWEIARRQGMVTSVSMEDWDELEFMRRGKWDHEFHAKNVSQVQDHTTDYGHLHCFGGQEVGGTQLSHTRAVHQAYDKSGGRVLSFTYITSMHQTDTRHGQVVDYSLQETLKSFENLETPTAVLIFADHGSQFAQAEDEASERYLPLGLFLPPRGAPKSWATNLRSNEFAVTSMADLHSTLLHRIAPDLQPLHASWPYKVMGMWPVQAVDLATTVAGSRSPAALGIQARHHPCSSPFMHMNASEINSGELSGAASYLTGQLNELGGNGLFRGGQCRPLRLLAVSSGKLYIREPFQLQLTFDVETVPVAGLPQHKATYTGAVHRFWGFCQGHMKSACLLGGIFPWKLDEVEPVSTYSQYEGCMGSDINATDQKRFCICDA